MIGPFGDAISSIARLGLSVLAATMWPLAAHAQSSATGFSPPAPWDVAFITGFHAAHPDVPGDVRYSDD